MQSLAKRLALLLLFTDAGLTAGEQDVDESCLMQRKVNVSSASQATMDARNGKVALLEVMGNAGFGVSAKPMLGHSAQSSASSEQKSMSFTDVLSSVASGTAFKIFLGLDDLAVLGPMIAHRKSRSGKLRVVILYCFSSCIVVTLAYYLGAVVSKISSATESLRFWVAFCSGTFLMVYATYMAYSEGWFARCGLLGDSDENQDEDAKPDDCDDEDMTQVFIITLTASIDDVSALFLVGASGLFTWYALGLGSFLGSLILASIFLIGTESENISAVLEKVPVCLVLFLVGLYTTSKAFEPPGTLHP